MKNRLVIHDDCRAVFSTPSGERVLKYLVKTFVNVRIRQPGDTCCDMAYKDGKRQVVQDLISFTNKDPEYFYKLLEETDYGN